MLRFFIATYMIIFIPEIIRGKICKDMKIVL